MKAYFDVQQLTQFEFGAILITILITGLVLGCLLGYGLLKRKISPKSDAAMRVKQELDEYKEQVNEHFEKTSGMFQDVTTQYKKLYDHMAIGAVELCEADSSDMPRLEMKNNDERDPKSEFDEDEDIDEDSTTDSINKEPGNTEDSTEKPN